VSYIYSLEKFKEREAELRRLESRDIVLVTVRQRQALASWKQCVCVCVTGEPGTGVQSVAVPLDPSQRDADRLNRTAYFRALSAVGVIPDAVGVAGGLQLLSQTSL